MKIQFIYQDDQEQTKSEHTEEFGDEDWAFDDLGGYLVDDIKELRLGHSITIRKEAV